MGLESLLERLEGRPVTPVTPGHTGGVTENTATKQACNTVTPVTPETIESEAENIPEALAHPSLEERCPVDTRHRLPPAALAEIPPDDPAQRRIKVSILGKNGLMVTIVTQSAWTLGDWKRFAWRHYDVHTGVHGCTFEEDGEGGPALAEAQEQLKRFFQEKTAILERAGLPQPEAEAEAARLVATLARNRSCSWASLRTALSDYPTLLSQVPDRPGPVDSLPWGTATVHAREGAKPGPVSGSIVITEAEIEAARKGRTLVRQGDFTGAPEVKP